MGLVGRLRGGNLKRGLNARIFQRAQMACRRCRSNGGTARRGDGETGRRGDGETRRRGDGETGRRGDGETGRRGDGEVVASGYSIGSSLGARGMGHGALGIHTYSSFRITHMVRRHHYCPDAIIPHHPIVPITNSHIPTIPHRSDVPTPSLLIIAMVLFRIHTYPSFPIAQTFRRHHSSSSHCSYREFTHTHHSPSLKRSDVITPHHPIVPIGNSHIPIIPHRSNVPTPSLLIIPY